MSRAVGTHYENEAAKFLEARGLKIIARNVSYSFGELDLVAKDGETLVFVEVKHRKQISHGMPFEAVTISKQRKIIKAAKAFIQRMPKTPFCRFDVISIMGTAPEHAIEHLKDAFWDEE